MLYLNTNNQVCCGDKVDFQRDLTTEEVEMWNKYQTLAVDVKTIRDAKYTEIITKSDEMCRLIEAKYSQLEIKRFPEQQTGAEAIIAGKSEPSRAVQLVKSLALADGVSATEFAHRIMGNVVQADMASTAILTQQRAYETALKQAGPIEKIEAINVNYILG